MFVIVHINQFSVQEINESTRVQLKKRVSFFDNNYFRASSCFVLCFVDAFRGWSALKTSAISVLNSFPLLKASPVLHCVVIFWLLIATRKQCCRR